MFLEFEELSKLLSNVPKRDVFLEFEELRGVGYVYLDGCLSVYFPLFHMFNMLFQPVSSSLLFQPISSSLSASASNDNSSSSN